MWYSDARRHWNRPDLCEGHDRQNEVWQQEQHTEHRAGGQSGSRGQGRSPAKENRGQISNGVLTDHFINFIEKCCTCLSEECYAFLLFFFFTPITMFWVGFFGAD